MKNQKDLGHVFPKYCSLFQFLPLTVQFEDIDAGGVVHHPNYLKYCERGRCAAMASQGFSYQACLKENFAFVVAEALGKYVSPARLGDELVVATANIGFRKSSILAFQAIVRAAHLPHDLFCPQQYRVADFMGLVGKNLLFCAQLRLVCVNLASGKPLAMSQGLRAAFALPALGAEQDDWRYGKISLDSSWSICSLL